LDSSRTISTCRAMPVCLPHIVSGRTTAGTAVAMVFFILNNSRRQRLGTLIRTGELHSCWMNPDDALTTLETTMWAREITLQSERAYCQAATLPRTAQFTLRARYVSRPADARADCGSCDR
jgi:hypothetical protein